MCRCRKAKKVAELRRQQKKKLKALKRLEEQRRAVRDNKTDLA